MLSVQEALSQILTDIQVLEPGKRSLRDALGHVLSEDAISLLDIPSFPNSAVDGFVLRADAILGASPSAPIDLRLVGEIKAGDAPTRFPSGNNCVRIMTGAPIPEGADAVVMKEDVTEQPGPVIRFSEAVSAGENIRPRGQDIQHGQTAVPAGTLLRPSEIAMLSGLGMPEARVFPRPRVAILTTGDEVIEPGTALHPGQIYNSNRYLLESLTRSIGVEVGHVAHLPDSLDGTIAALEAASSGHDALLSTGGVSVGEHDHVRAAIQHLGAVQFWRVAMKPGKPIVYGRIGNTPCFGLPGNPVSSMVGFEVFVRPALLKMAGHRRLDRLSVTSRLLGPISHQPGREEYARVRTYFEDGEFVSDPHPGQGSHLLSSMVAANSLAVVPAESDSLTAGDHVNVLMTEWPAD